MRKDIHSKRVWSESGAKYGSSNINTWLNGDFFNSLGSAEQSAIKQAKIPYGEGNQNDKVNSGASGLPCKVFLLSAYELGWTTSDSRYLIIDGASLDYFKGLPYSDSKRQAYYDGSPTQYWTRSTTTYMETSVVWATSIFSYQNSASSSYGIRPALILPKTAKFDKDTKILKG